MKRIVLRPGIIAAILSCIQACTTNTTVPVKDDPVHKRTPDKEQEQAAIRRANEEEEKAGRIRMQKLLDTALKIAHQNINASGFSNEYESIPDSLYIVKTKLGLGNFFSGKHQHLIVHRSNPAFVYIDIFLKKKDTFESVAFHKEWEITYVSDTLRDVNGDGFKDFLVNWYGSSGCCLKNICNVYLYQPRNGGFSKTYKFINPTFDSKEQVIRGVEYGHPGETEIYKFKWSGLMVDTVEYIFYEKNDKGIKTGKVIRQKHAPGKKSPQKTERLNSVPQEYKGIFGYDWFTGKV